VRSSRRVHKRVHWRQSATQVERLEFIRLDQNAPELAGLCCACVDSPLSSVGAMGTTLVTPSVAIRSSSARHPLLPGRNFQHPPGASPERSLR
jgi:hypothetical protein